jgi:phosphohistidine phosphatase
MRLFFLRHGAADWPDWKKPDDERPLTKAGRKEMHAVGEFFAARKLKVDRVLTSPLPRAEQTADIIAEHLKIVVKPERLLAPGFRADDLTRLLRKHPGDALMLVGHEPDFSKVIKSLTGGEVKLSKAGLALVDYEKKKGKLLWLIPPKLTIKLQPPC